MKPITFIAIPISLSLIGCSASVSSNLKNGNYSFLTQDVAVSHFGTNYMINAPLQVGNERITAEAFATECESGHGTLWIKAYKYDDNSTYNSVLAGPEKTDEIFSTLCSKGLPIARSMEAKLTEEQVDDRKAATGAALSYMLNQSQKQQRSKSPSKRALLMERQRAEDADQKQRNYSCTTTYNLGSAHTTCNHE